MVTEAEKVLLCILFVGGCRVTMLPGESWIFLLKFPGPGKSQKMSLVLEIKVQQSREKLWNLLVV